MVSSPTAAPPPSARSAADPAGTAIASGAQRVRFAAPLQPALVRAAVPAAYAADLAIETVLETGSTNADLLARARVQALAAPVLRAALSQTAGRGRYGRRWFAAPGAALLFSLALPLPAALRAPGAMTLAFGVALIEALAEALPDPVLPLRLKWRNDLLLDGAKLGGVLAELASDAQGQRTLVAGVGINLWLDEPARASIDQPATALAGRVPLEALATQRERLLGACAGALLAAAARFVHEGFVPFQARYMQRFALAGSAVAVTESGSRVAQGRALGVDGQGRLLVECDGRLRSFAAGEVTLRAADEAQAR
jgi:BirA family biotin operon repressor/biotin-[acetyl-CoA-carboxylase] ligase